MIRLESDKKHGIKQDIKIAIVAAQPFGSLIFAVNGKTLA